VKPRLARRALLLAAILPLAGCFDFDAPLGPPTTPIDARLLGSWRCIGFEAQTTDTVGTIQFAALDGTQYDIGPGPGCEGSDCMDRFRAHITKVAGMTLLNARELKDGELAAKWNFVRYTFHRPNVLQLELADDEVLKVKPETTETLRRGLERERRNPKLFQDYLVCLKVVPKDPEPASPAGSPTPAPAVPPS
jgi:hypothetical protein